MKLSKCHIAAMLLSQRRRHISFHTPGHKRAGADITELSYSDNLYAPQGAIARAQRDIAEILGAEHSFILTDGSTSGIFAMLYALKSAGCKSVALPVFSHISVKNGCDILGLEQVAIACGRDKGIPLQPTLREIEAALLKADALLLTSPDYYGNFAPLSLASELCRAAGKPFIIDGAHGGHLHFCDSYAGRYCDMWVDGVHKSLPALTQGAVVSAKSPSFAEKLEEGVRVFHTTSPSYPIMASVEYAVKKERNLKIEEAAARCKAELDAYPNDDWTKIILPFGSYADVAQKELERQGLYPEFNDGAYLAFYLSPCTKAGELKKLVRAVKKLSRASLSETAPQEGAVTGVAEYLPLREAIGRVCAKACGTIPPCTPAIGTGERVTESAVERLERAQSVFGLKDGKILVFSTEERV